MGMYAEIDGHEFKFSGLIAEAIHRVKKSPDGYYDYVAIAKTDVAQVLAELDHVIKASGIIGGGSVSSSNCYQLASAAKFAGLLVEWSLFGGPDEIIFG